MIRRQKFVRVVVNLPDAVVRDIDLLAREVGLTREQYIREVMKQHTSREDTEHLAQGEW